jgi:peptidyl-prolyl cis-trans isomerase D
MRKNQRYIWAAVIVVIVITFVFWGVATGPSRSQTGTVATIFGEEISRQQYLDAYRAVYLTMLMFTGRDPERSDEGKQMLEQQTWLRLIQRQKIKEYGITVPDEELTTYVWTFPMFLTNGQPDRKKYEDFGNQFLRSKGFSTAEFEQIMSEQLALQKLHGIVGSTAKLLPAEMRQLYDLSHEKIDVSVVLLDAASYTNAITLTDAEIKDYFEKQKDLFRIPERRKLRYVRFSPEAYTNEFKEVSDFEVKDEYEKNASVFVDQKGQPMPFDKVAADLRAQILHRKREQRAQDQATQLMLEISNQREDGKKPASSVDFVETAKKFHLTAVETDYLDPGAPVPNAEPGFTFFRAAYALTPEEPFSEVVRCEDGYYVLQFLGKKETELPSFEAARERVVTRMTRERALDMARAKGREAARNIRKALLDSAAGKPAVSAADTARQFADEARKLGLTVLSPDPFTQSDIPKTLPEGYALLNAAFTMRPGEVSEFMDTARGGLFLLLEERVQPTDEQFLKDRAQFAEQALARKREMVVNEWASKLFQASNPPQPKPQQQPQPPPIGGAAEAPKS